MTPSELSRKRERGLFAAHDPGAGDGTRTHDVQLDTDGIRAASVYC